MEQVTITKGMLEFLERAKAQFNESYVNAVINEKEGYIAFRDGISENNIRLYRIDGEPIVFQGQLRNQHTKIVDEVKYRKLEKCRDKLYEIRSIVDGFDELTNFEKYTEIYKILNK